MYDSEILIVKRLKLIKDYNFKVNLMIKFNLPTAIIYIIVLTSFLYLFSLLNIYDNIILNKNKMKDRTKSILIAISFIVAMALFVWGFNFLKGKSLLNNQFEFYAVYDNSKGLLPGDLVTINGMQVGTVSSLNFHPKQDGSIIVEFTTNNDLNIPENSIAKLSSSLMGSVSINLVLGNSEKMAQNGDTLMATIDNGAMDMVTETILPLKNNLETLLLSLND